LAKDHLSAIAALQEAVSIRRTLGDTIAVASALNSLGGAQRDSGDLVAAERDYREAMQIFKANRNDEGLATSTGNLAELAVDRKDWLGAEALARDALLLAERVGRLVLVGADCKRLALALVRQGKKREALPHATRAVEIFRKVGSPELSEAREIFAECER
jgi:tetratricopeptide (TPR) repeat protein